MKCYQVQFVLPVDKPEDNVRVTRGQDGYYFDVPTNLPGCAHLGFADLLRMATGIEKPPDGLIGMPALKPNKIPRLKFQSK